MARRNLLRRALLAYRDGARLHAGTRLSHDDLMRLAPKVAYLLQVGFSKSEALMALLAVSQFTNGCVMEEQARDGNTIPPSTATTDSEPLKDAQPLAINMAKILTANAEETFEFGLNPILAGLRRRIGERR